MSDSVQPRRWQPTRLLCPQASPGKNTGVGCHFLLQCMKVKSESEVIQSCPTLSDPMDCSLPSSSIHGILQARVLEWVAIAFSGAQFYLFPNGSSFVQHLLKKKKLSRLKLFEVLSLSYTIFFYVTKSIFEQSAPQVREFFVKGQIASSFGSVNPMSLSGMSLFQQNFIYTEMVNCIWPVSCSLVSSGLFYCIISSVHL